ncbi:class F sortase [Streptomyces sp. NPDC002795]|uniref:class F sortase n=1 Tax=Streptomyces sp. NPDC002795 TaxID=3364665 RepID=UPI0036BFF717
MTGSPPPGHRRGRDLSWIAATALCALLALTAVLTWFTDSGPAHDDGAPNPARLQASSASTSTPKPATPTFPDARDDSPTPAPLARAADPVRLQIPAIDLDTAIDPLSLDPEGRLPAPAGPTDVGWWREGPAPGEAGPAAIVGHLDTTSGPAVFAGLTALRPGDRVLITRADNSTAVFVVRSTKQFPQDDFPSRAVYGPTPDAQLRLITCGGTYDRAAGRYLSNTVVSATMTDP